MLIILAIILFFNAINGHESQKTEEESIYYYYQPNQIMEYPHAFDHLLKMTKYLYIQNLQIFDKIQIITEDQPVFESRESSQKSTHLYHHESITVDPTLLQIIEIQKEKIEEQKQELLEKQQKIELLEKIQAVYDIYNQELKMDLNEQHAVQMDMGNLGGMARSFVGRSRQSNIKDRRKNGHAYKKRSKRT